VPVRNRKVDRLGGEIHRHQRGNVGDGEALASHERSLAQSIVEIGEEILHPELAALCQLGNLIVVMRPGDRAADDLRLARVYVPEKKLLIDELTKVRKVSYPI